MLHVHRVNLQGIVSGYEVDTRSVTRGLADAGAWITLYVNSANRSANDRY